MNRRKNDYNEEEDAPDLGDYRSIRLCNLHKIIMIYMACVVTFVFGAIVGGHQADKYWEGAIDKMSSRYMQGDSEFDAEYQELREKEAINVPVSKR